MVVQPPVGDQQSLISRAKNWLTAGYPEGIPATDRFAVIALLKRRLSDDQIRRIVSNITLTWAESDDVVIREDEVAELIEHVLQQPPSEADLQRVSARLSMAGWPLEDSLEAAARRNSD